MDDPLRVRGLEGLSELGGDGECFLERQGAGSDSIRKCLALHELRNGRARTRTSSMLWMVAICG